MLRCQDIAYAYPNSKTVLEHLNLFADKDEFIAIVGPTGIGKSTLLRILARLVDPTLGHVYLDGNEVLRPSSRISLIHQSIATFPWMTALDNVKLALRGKGLSDDDTTEISENMLQLVGLKDVELDYPKEMSGGMRQRVAIARALAASPEVLLLDEPFVHLDEFTAQGLREEIHALLFNPDTSLKSAVMVSHNLREVVQLADRVYVLNGSPATVTDLVTIDLPKPRSDRDPDFFTYTDLLFNDLGMKPQV